MRLPGGGGFIEAHARQAPIGMATAAIEARGLAKSFGGLVAVSPLTLRLEEGEIFALLGSNGAGKTTAIRMLTTLLKPSAGTALVHGRDVVRESEQVRRLIGVVSDRINLYPDLSAEQNLRFFARLYRVPEAQVEAAVKQALTRVSLWDRRRDAVGGYSFGMRKRAEIACALVHSPRVLFMDEATTGIDPQNSLRIRHLARELAHEGMTILWTTHLMQEPERLCDRVGIMSRGELKAVGRPQELSRLIEREKVVEVTTAAGASAEQVLLLAGLLRRQGLDAHVEDPASGVLRVVVARDFDVSRILRVTESFGYIHSVNTLEPSLEDVFLHYAAEPGAEAA